ncbi:hypothetical protein [Streptomyces pilosus]
MSRPPLCRIESIEERLARPVPDPLPGQQTLPADLLHALHGRQPADDDEP